MSKIRALALLLCLFGAVAPGTGGARAGGLRFGGSGFHLPQLVAPHFAAPRDDGPAASDREAPAAPGARLGVPATPPAGPQTCYSAAETRQRVAAGNLRPAFEMMLKATSLTQADALAGKLCRWNNQDIYVISLLRRNGAVVRVFMDAQTGRVVAAPNLH
jgi:hypothetical protein